MKSINITKTEIIDAMQARLKSFEVYNADIDSLNIL